MKLKCYLLCLTSYLHFLHELYICLQFHISTINNIATSTQTCNQYLSFSCCQRSNTQNHEVNQWTRVELLRLECRWRIRALSVSPTPFLNFRRLIAPCAVLKTPKPNWSAKRITSARVSLFFISHNKENKNA